MTTKLCKTWLLPIKILDTHTHTEIECCLVESGSGKHMIDGKTYDAQERSMFWILPHQKHAFIEASPNALIWVALFPVSFLKILDLKIDQRISLTKNTPNFEYSKQLGLETYDLMLNRFREVHNHYRKKSEKEAAMQYFLSYAWRLFQTDEVNLLASKFHPSVKKAFHLLMDRYLSLDEVSLKVNLTPSHLSRLFHKETGMTLNKHRNKYSLRRFFKIYENDRCTAHEAALKAGFGSYTQCYRICKLFTGQGPKKKKF